MSRTPGQDRRAPQPGPLFRERVRRLGDAGPGTRLSGRVANVTDFGAFVDCGLGTDGLLHLSAGPARVAALAPGQTVEVVGQVAPLSRCLCINCTATSRAMYLMMKQICWLRLPTGVCAVGIFLVCAL